MYFFFFFQAEDGIRDLYVTGVQTCALPIFGSPISKVNLLTATRSLVVVTDADRMLTCWSEMDRVTSDSSPVRSRASTWMATRNSESSVGDQRTATSRSGWESSRWRRFRQSARCTETPWPRVMNPVISSPGTGVQHLDSRAHTSAAPSTTTPESPAGGGLGG